MDRMKEIRESLKPYIVNWAREKIEEAASNPEDSLTSAVMSVLKYALKRQRSVPLWKPAYLGLFHLMSSLITESYGYELMVADQQIYLDDSMVTGIWKPDFLHQNEEEEKLIKKVLEKQFVRLNSYEVSYAKRLVFYEYRSITGVYWKEHLDKITGLEEFKCLNKDKPFRFLFGDYMGEVHTVLDDKEVAGEVCVSIDGKSIY